MSTAPQTPPDLPIETIGESLWERASIVWIVPFGALLIALAIAWQHWRDRGPLIEIAFENAAGIRATETEVRFRDVTVGLVEELGLADDMRTVTVGVRLDPDIADYVDDDAVFWVVRPEVSARGVSGLDTVLSGVFIEGDWNTSIDAAKSAFVGLDEAPLLSPGQQGLQLTLRAAGQDGIAADTTILYQGIEVGEIGPGRIAPDGSSALANAVIYAPYDKLITTTTRFWNNSGFSFSFGPNGASIDFATLSSLLVGGVTFNTGVSGGSAATDGMVFDLYDDEETARTSLFARPDGPQIEFTLVFDSNVAGLRVDAPVELSGLRVGRITNLTGLVDPDRFGDTQVRLLATMALQPERLGLSETGGGVDPMDFLRQSVAEGMRARLTNVSILTGGLKVDLVTLPQEPAARINETTEPYPVFPTAPAVLADVAATAEGVFDRINALPIEELLEGAIAFMGSATALVASEDVKQTPADLRGVLGDIRGLVGSPDTQAIPANVNALLSELDATTRALSETLTTIKQAETIAQITATLEAVEETARAASASVDGVPELVDQVNAVVAKLDSVPLNQMAEDLSGVLDAVEALIDTPQARALPTDLSGALDEVARVLRALREGGTVANVNTTLKSASDAADAVAVATQQLPDLVKRLDAVIAQAQTTLAGFDGNSPLNRDARMALRALSDAAKSINGLANTLERRPNSIILGR